MKYRLVAFLFLSHLGVFGQSLYNPVFIDQCSGKELEVEFTLIDESGEMHFFYDIFRPGVIIQKPGAYAIDLGFNSPIDVNIESADQKDTFYHPELYIPMCICSPPPQHYEHCGLVANGYIIDYYSDGKIRREGTFENGNPTDTVKTYYYSGEIKEYHIPQIGGDKRVSFYKNGNVKRQFDIKREEEHEYYESGQLASYEHHYGKKRIEEDYYENGTLKRKQDHRTEIRYSVLGQKTDVLKRKIEYGRFNRRFRSYEIRWLRMNTEDEVQAEITFSMDQYPRYPKNISEIDLNDIDQVMLFEKGKPTKKVVVNSDYQNGDFHYSITIFNRFNDEWIELRTDTLETLKEFL